MGSATDLGLFIRAVSYSADKHRFQRRKGADAPPYINHAIEVADLLANRGGVRELPTLLAAVLHDTVEDTDATYEELEEEFGREVRLLVAEVTDDKSLPKTERKRLQVEHAPRMSPQARQIKIADKICNVRDVSCNPPMDWSVRRRREYLAWAERVVDGCRGADPNLARYFDEVLRQGMGEAGHEDMKDRFRRVEEELESVKALVSQLQREVTDLRRAEEFRKHPVEVFLQQRGFPVLVHGASAQLLLSPDAPRPHRDAFYDLLKRYSFRLFLRDLIQFQAGDDPAALGRYCSMGTVRSYLKSLSDLGVVETAPGKGYRLIPNHVPSFGPTLEWYVCEIFRREFLAPAIFNVRLDHTRYGGDYDVLAVIAGFLACVEVKSSPPRGVELPSVCAFRDRLRELAPHLAVFLVDTELRMKDKIVPLFEEALAGTASGQEAVPVERLVDEIFHIGHAVYLVNSRRGIYSNLRRCVRDFLRRERRPGGSPDREVV